MQMRVVGVLHAILTYSVTKACFDDRAWSSVALSVGISAGLIFAKTLFWLLMQLCMGIVNVTWYNLPLGYRKTI